MTVEAVFVLPVILIVILCLMYMTLILHDKVVLQSVAEEALVRFNQLCHQPSDVLSSEINYDKLLDVSLLGEDNEKHREELMYFINQEVKGKLFICQVNMIDIDITEDSCQIDIEADSKISFSLALEYIKGGKKIFVSQNRDSHHPEEFARKAEVITGTITQVKGADCITEFLSKVGDFLGK